MYETLGGDGSSDIENTFGWGEGDNEDAPELDLDEVLEVDGDGEKAEFIRVRATCCRSCLRLLLAPAHTAACNHFARMLAPLLPVHMSIYTGIY